MGVRKLTVSRFNLYGVGHAEPHRQDKEMEKAKNEKPYSSPNPKIPTVILNSDRCALDVSH